jgi:hypothetical protein
MQESLQKLQDEGLVVALKNSETKSTVLFPVDPAYSINVNPEFKAKWKEVKVVRSPLAGLTSPTGS